MPISRLHSIFHLVCTVFSSNLRAILKVGGFKYKCKRRTSSNKSGLTSQGPRSHWVAICSTWVTPAYSGLAFSLQFVTVPTTPHLSPAMRTLAPIYHFTCTLIFLTIEKYLLIPRWKVPRKTEKIEWVFYTQLISITEVRFGSRRHFSLQRRLRGGSRMMFTKRQYWFFYFLRGMWFYVSWSFFSLHLSSFFDFSLWWKRIIFIKKTLGVTWICLREYVYMNIFSYINTYVYIHINAAMWWRKMIQSILVRKGSADPRDSLCTFSWVNDMDFLL